MTPKYFRFSMWDDRPYGVSQHSSGNEIEVIFEKNDSLWFDFIRGTSSHFLSDRFVRALISNGLLDQRSVIKAKPHTPIRREKENPFLGYWQYTPPCEWSLSSGKHQWPGENIHTDRWKVELDAPDHLGRIRDKSTNKLMNSFCDLKFLLLAREIGASNFFFRPLDLPDYTDVFSPPFRIDYLGKQWPPKWYPDGFEPHPNNLTDDLPPDPLKAPGKTR
jgi:hypothetical protein